MSTFKVLIRRIRAIETHPNADSLEFAQVEGYRSIVRKGEFQAGALVAYIPEDSVLPQWLLRAMNLWDEAKGKGALSGPAGDRVRAVRLRGEVSQGLCYPVVQDSADTGQIITGSEPGCFANVREGDDVASLLGVTKYVQQISPSMSGEIFNASKECTLEFDVENIKAFPDVFSPGEPVVFTEKLHGTCTVVAVLPLANSHPEAFGAHHNILVFSKGLGAKGQVFKNNEANSNNLYVTATKELREAIEKLPEFSQLQEPLFILGETYGKGVQDLTYGESRGLRLFAAARGFRDDVRYLDWEDVQALADKLGAATVPVVYRGPFSQEALQEHTTGRTLLGADHIREGIVVVPEKERSSPGLGRACLKSISTQYLLRKNGTEYN